MIELRGTTLLRPAIVISAALLLVLLAAVLIWNGLHPQGNKGTTAALALPANAQATVIANTDIAPGQVLAASDLTLKLESSAHSPATALHQITDAQDHVALVAIHAGSPLLSSAISATPVQGIAPHIPVGYRAYAIAVNEAETAGGFLQAGDRVDLYVTLPGALFGGQTATGQKADDQSKSTLLLQGVTVLAVGTKLQTNGTPDTTARTVTLALNTDALSKIALAARLGTITFAIRNPIDQGTAPDQVATIDALTGTSPPAPTPVRHITAASGTEGIVLYAGKDRSVLHVH